MYSKLVNNATLYDAIKLLQDRIPDFLDIREVRSKLYVTLRKDYQKTMPLQLMGDGFIALLRLIFLVTLSKNGVILFEEPEMTLHPGFMEILADEIIEYSSVAQFFMTTHSAELLQSILEAGKKVNMLDRINIIRLLKHRDGFVDREILSGYEALEEIEEIKTDLRGY